MVQAAQTTANQHAEYTDHNIHPRGSQILERRVTNNHKRLCLESWHSTLDNAAVNERKMIPHTYLLLIQTTNVLVASTRTNLQVATMMKGDRSHRKNRLKIINLQKGLSPIETLEVEPLLPSPLAGILVHCGVTPRPNGRSITGGPSSCRATHILMLQKWH